MKPKVYKSLMGWCVAFDGSGILCSSWKKAMVEAMLGRDHGMITMPISEFERFFTGLV